MKIRMMSLQEDIQVPVTHISHHLSSHLLNTFAEQLILHEVVLEARDIATYLKRGPKNMVYGSNVWYPPVGHTHSSVTTFYV